jgi:hypothetical protein
MIASHVGCGGSQPAVLAAVEWGCVTRDLAGESEIEDRAAFYHPEMDNVFQSCGADRCVQLCIESARMRKATIICSS